MHFRKHLSVILCGDTRALSGDARPLADPLPSAPAPSPVPDL